MGPHISSRIKARYVLYMVALVALITSGRQSSISRYEARMARSGVEDMSSLQQQLQTELKALQTALASMDRDLKAAQKSQDEGTKGKLAALVLDVQEVSDSAVAIQRKLDTQQEQVSLLQAQLQEQSAAAVQHAADVKELKVAQARAERSALQQEPGASGASSSSGSRTANGSDRQGSGMQQGSVGDAQQLDVHAQDQIRAGRDPGQISTLARQQEASSEMVSDRSEISGNLAKAHAAVLAAKKQEHADKMESLQGSILGNGSSADNEQQMLNSKDSNSVSASSSSSSRDGINSNGNDGRDIDEGGGSGSGSGSGSVSRQQVNGLQEGEQISGAGVAGQSAGLGASRNAGESRSDSTAEDAGMPHSGSGVTGQVFSDAHAALQTAAKMSHRGVVDGGRAGSLRVGDAEESLPPEVIRAAEDVDRALVDRGTTSGLTGGGRSVRPDAANSSRGSFGISTGSGSASVNRSSGTDAGKMSVVDARDAMLDVSKRRHAAKMAVADRAASGSQLISSSDALSSISHDAVQQSDVHTSAQQSISEGALQLEQQNGNGQLHNDRSTGANSRRSRKVGSGFNSNTKNAADSYADALDAEDASS